MGWHAEDSTDAIEWVLTFWPQVLSVDLRDFPLRVRLNWKPLVNLCFSMKADWWVICWGWSYSASFFYFPRNRMAFIPTFVYAWKPSLYSYHRNYFQAPSPFEAIHHCKTSSGWRKSPYWSFYCQLGRRWASTFTKVCSERACSAATREELWQLCGWVGL